MLFISFIFFLPLFVFLIFLYLIFFLVFLVFLVCLVFFLSSFSFFSPVSPSHYPSSSPSPNQYPSSSPASASSPSSSITLHIIHLLPPIIRLLNLPLLDLSRPSKVCSVSWALPPCRQRTRHRQARLQAACQSANRDSMCLLWLCDAVAAAAAAG